MATGDQSDFVARLRAALPLRWFPTTTIGGTSATPILDGVLSGLALPWASNYALYAYTSLQTRIATATDSFLDFISLDFFGTGLPRIAKEADSQFRERIQDELFRPRGTRQAVYDELGELTGRIPWIFEPTRPADTGSYGAAGTFPWLLSDDFTAESVLSPSWTFTRPSNATYFDSTGTLQTAGFNFARFDHAPGTGTALGLLMEQASTNGIRNPRAENAVIGTPGVLPTYWSIVNATSVSTQVVAYGTENGMSFVDVRFYGTPTSSAAIGIHTDANNAIATPGGNPWSLSVYTRLIAGSLTNLGAATMVLTGIASDGTTQLGSQYGAALTPTSSALVTQRSTLSVTLSTYSGGTTYVAGRYQMSVTSGSAIDVTLRFAGPQLEQAVMPTSLILPPAGSPAAATRVADVCLSTLAGTTNAVSGFCEFQTPNTGGIALEVTDATGLTDAAYAWISAGNINWQVQGVSLGAAYTPNSVSRIAFSADPTGSAAQVAGSTYATNNTGTVAAAFTTVALGGGSGGGNQLGGWVRKVALYGYRRPSGDVTTMSAFGWQPGIEGTYTGSLLGYGANGGYGSLMLPFQAFIVAYRPVTGGIPQVAGYGSATGWAGGTGGAAGLGCPVGAYGAGSTHTAVSGSIEYGSLSLTTGNIPDETIYAAVDSTKPAAMTAWTRISN